MFLNLSFHFFLCLFLVSCSDDKTLRIWQCYEPGNEEGIIYVLVQKQKGNVVIVNKELIISKRERSDHKPLS